MTRDWPEKIRNAQGLEHVVLGGRRYRRIRWCAEARGMAQVPCPDCEVEPGQLHVPACDREKCPGAGGRRSGAAAAGGRRR